MKMAVNYLDLARKSSKSNGAVYYLEKAETEFLQLSQAKWLDCDKNLNCIKIWQLLQRC
jgi:hypothetical protein